MIGSSFVLTWQLSMSTKHEVGFWTGSAIKVGIIGKGAVKRKRGFVAGD